MSKSQLQSIQELMEIVGGALSENGIEDDQVTESVTRGILDAFSGQMLYFPTDHSRKIAERDIELATSYDGTGEHMAELCRKHGLSSSAFYHAIKRGRRLLQKKYQRDLFEEDEA